MKHESDKTNDLKIFEDNLTFQSIYSKDYYPLEISKPTEQINLLLIPIENFRGEKKLVFPEQTMDFFKFIESTSHKSVISEIALSDDDYSELELHADLVTLATMVIESGIFPLVVDIVSNYINQKILLRNSESKIKVNIKIVKDESSIDVTYEGDADKFKQTIESVKILNE